MKEILRRSVTGAVYIVLLLSSIFLSSDAFDFLLMIFGLACIYEYKRMVGLRGYYLFLSYLALWWIFIYIIKEHDKIPINILMFLTILVDLMLLYRLFSNKQKTYNIYQKFIAGLFYIGGGCIFLTMIPYKNEAFAKFLIMGILILMWVNDSFAYLVGRTIGRTKLYPAVSPKKTVEGAIGGLLFTLLSAFLMARYLMVHYEPSITLVQWVILAAIIVFVGSLGDLVESKLKRLAGVKDSGALLPGHGGMLDRLDSLIFAAPFAYLTLNIFTHVS